MAPYNGKQVCEIRELSDHTWLIRINGQSVGSAPTLAEAKLKLPEHIHLTIYSTPSHSYAPSNDRA